MKSVPELLQILVYVTVIDKQLAEWKKNTDCVPGTFLDQLNLL